MPAEEAAAAGGRGAEFLSERLRTMPENHDPPPADEEAGADVVADGEDEEREDGEDRFMSGCLRLRDLCDGGGNKCDGMEITFKLTFSVAILFLM